MSKELVPRVVVTVISDLVTDQRVHKVCKTLQENGFDVLLIGSKIKNSRFLDPRSYQTKRISLFFSKKVFFYAEYNIKLFFKLLFTKAQILVGNDLDVMLATYMAARLKSIPVVYDTHEYFLEMAGLQGKPFIRFVWKKLEQWIFPRVKYIYTICDSFCELYYQDYKKRILSIRNVPYKIVDENYGKYASLIQSESQKIPTDKRIILLQGNGINQNRGGEEVVLSMQFLNPDIYHLLLIGGGKAFKNILNLIEDKKLQDRISVIPSIPFSALRYFTSKAHLGISADKDNTLNHKYGLPNKIFDYLHCNVPVLASRLIELEKIVTSYNVGMFFEKHDPAHIAACIEEAFRDEKRYATWKENCNKVREELNWENESKILLALYNKVKKDNRL